MSQINKIYLSNFLTGLVFWYGIEKLFMLSIGITAYSVGTITALFIVVTLLLDIPSGMLADRWSRKGTLAPVSPKAKYLKGQESLRRAKDADPARKCRYPMGFKVQGSIVFRSTGTTSNSA